MSHMNDYDKIKAIAGEVASKGADHLHDVIYIIMRMNELHKSGPNGNYGYDCYHCETLWPCSTIKILQDRWDL